MKRLTRPLALAGALALLVAACSDDTPAPGATGADAYQRIVSLSPTHTEVLFAIGAGERVVAVDDFSNFPPEAAAVASDLSGFEPNPEAIAGYDPDLVVIGGDFTGLTEQLAALDIPVWSGEAPATLEDAYAQIIDLGVQVGRADAAQAVVDGMRADIAAAVASIPAEAAGLTYYHELDDTFYSVSSTSFAGSVYALFGLTNIVEQGAVEGDYPQLSAEFIVETDPDLIFLACTVYCGITPEAVAARPGWDGLSAVTNGRVVPLNDDIVSRWGPRLVDFVTTIASALHTTGASQD